MFTYQNWRPDAYNKWNYNGVINFYISSCRKICGASGIKRQKTKNKKQKTKDKKQKTKDKKQKTKDKKQKIKKTPVNRHRHIHRHIHRQSQSLSQSELSS